MRNFLNKIQDFAHEMLKPGRLCRFF